MEYNNQIISDSIIEPNMDEDKDNYVVNIFDVNSEDITYMGNIDNKHYYMLTYADQTAKIVCMNNGVYERELSLPEFIPQR